MTIYWKRATAVETAWLGHPTRSTMPAYQRFCPQQAWTLALHMSRSPLYPALGWLCRLRGWPSLCNTTTHAVAAHPVGSPVIQRNYLPAC